MRLRVLLIVTLLLCVSEVHGAHLRPGTLASASTRAVAYRAGWNMIAGAGIAITGNVGPLYTYRPGDQEYELVQAGSALIVGQGYWAYFDQLTQIDSSMEGGLNGIALPAGQWVMVGRPPFTPPEAVGADYLYTYDNVGMQYRATGFLSEGQGAWALSLKGSVFRLIPPGAPPPSR